MIVIGLSIFFDVVVGWFVIEVDDVLELVVYEYWGKLLICGNIYLD